MKDKVMEYSLGIKSNNGSYTKVIKSMTRNQYEAYYDKVIAEGGKVIGIFTKEIL